VEKFYPFFLHTQQKKKMSNTKHQKSSETHQDTGPLKAVSFFSGAGGLDLGFHKCGFDIVAAHEINSDCCETYRVNIGDCTQVDLESFDETHLDFGDIDVVFGGPPCQGFSVLGNMRPNDPRNNLIFRFAAFVGRIKPRYFVMENVSALAKLAKWETTRKALIAEFESHGYHVNMFIVNAKDFQVPQNRERVLFIGTRKDAALITSLITGSKKVLAGDVLRSLPSAGTFPNIGICNAKIVPAKNPILRKSPYTGSLLFNGKGRVIDLDDFVKAMPASMGGNATPIVDIESLRKGHSRDSWIEHYHRKLLSGKSPVTDVSPTLRRITLTEAALLQTFPLDFKFSGTQSSQFRQIGNSVPPKLAYFIAKTIKRSLCM